MASGRVFIIAGWLIAVFGALGTLVMAQDVATNGGPGIKVFVGLTATGVGLTVAALGTLLNR